MGVYGDSAANPPEVNYYTLTTGDHAASAALSAAGHQALADMLMAEIAMMGSNVANTATVGWQGAGGSAMVLSSSQFLEMVGLAVAWFQQASLTAGEIVQAYHLAETTMIPGPMSDANRVEQGTLVATNIIGQNTPAIIALDTEYFGGHWPTNAAIMATYQAVVTAALTLLAIPPPITPLAPNPAAAIAAVGQAAGSAGINGALQASSQTMNQTANAAVQPTAQAAAAPADAMSAMGMPMQMLGQLSQFGQMAGQAPQLLSQAPQLLGQAVQLPMGLLGPLTQGMGGLGGAGSATSALGGAGLPGGAPMVSAAGLGGGGGGGGIGGGGAVGASYTRPVSSFNAPAQPKLPGAWNVAEPMPATTAASGPGTGGLYGTPMAPMSGLAGMGRDGAGGAERPATRTMQVTARPPGDRGDR